jgi:PAS domain S-box-containing protein
MSASLPWNETDRLAALLRYGILDTPPEPAFDNITRVASLVCKAPIAIVNLIADTRQFFKSETGLGIRETPLDISLCAQAILQPGVTVIPDATKDPRFNCNPLVTGELHLRFYAGARLDTPEGLPLGTVCILDTEARPEGLTDEQREVLLALAQQAMAQLELKRTVDLLGESEKRFRTLVEVSPQIVWFGSADGRITYCNPYWYAYTGLTPDDTSGDGWASVVHPDHRERVLDAWKKAVESVGEYEVEIPFRRASDGSYRWFLTKSLPVRDGAGRVERWIGIALDIHERKQAEEARELLSRELSHRIKNIFAVVSGLAILSARGRPDAQPFAGAFRERVQALAQAHEYGCPYSPDLPRSGKQTVQGLLRALLAPYLEDRQARFRVEGDDVPVGASAATALALIVHEHATNAVKYGALSQEGGHVHVSTEQVGDELILTWRERGGPAVPGPPEREGFGTLMAARSVAGSLNGTIVYDWAPTGLMVRLAMPVAALSR